VLEGLRARLEQLLADHSIPDDPRARGLALHAALLEGKVGLTSLREGLSVTERMLTNERQLLTDAERRGGLAREIGDAETTRVAEEFTARHRERVAVLERKLEVQREELRLTERDVESMTTEYRRLRQGGGDGPTPQQAAAWRDLEAAGGVRPETDLEGELLRSDLQRKQMDAAVAAQLEHLKKKMGKG